MKVLLVMLAVASSVACGLVRSYSVEPKSAALSGWTDTIRPYNYVSEVITTNFDSLTDPAYIECFVGDGNPTGYKVEVLTYPGQVTVASGDTDAVRGHTWVHFGHLNVTHPELIVKGRQLEFKFTRSGADSAA
jgi:hypothetical protein